MALKGGRPGWCQPQVGAIGPPGSWRNSGHEWISWPLRAEKDFRMWAVESLAHKLQACGSLLSTLGQIVILWGLPFNSPSAYLTVHLELNTDHRCLEISSRALKKPNNCQMDCEISVKCILKKEKKINSPKFFRKISKAFFSPFA